MADINNVVFTHPRQSTRTYVADVSAKLTPNSIISRLLTSVNGQPAFLSPISAGEQYHLVLHRTNTAIPPNQTLGGMGVRDRDVIHIILDTKAG